MDYLRDLDLANFFMIIIFHKILHLFIEDCVAEHFDCRVDKTQSVTFFASYSFAEEKDCTSRCCRNQECAGYSIDKNQKRCYLSKYKRSQANLYYKVGVTQCEKPSNDFFLFVYYNFFFYITVMGFFVQVKRYSDINLKLNIDY